MSERNPFAPRFEDMPETLPIFPLSGALLLPHGDLPLNIFEERYVNMIEDALTGSRLIGMIQPREEGAGHDKKAPIFDLGCAGKITDFSQTPDGRYMITLSGICRFKVMEEIETTRGYRLVKPDWSLHDQDTRSQPCFDMDREHLNALLKRYFEQEEMACDWAAIDKAADSHLITCLSMCCPLGHQEKQALLEAEGCADRAKIFMTMLEMLVQDTSTSNSKH